MVIASNGALSRVAAIEHITPGNWRGMVQARLRNVRTGAPTENRFRSEERVERVTLDQVHMEFLYRDGNDFYFMNTGNYEQIALPSNWSKPSSVS